MSDEHQTARTPEEQMIGSLFAAAERTRLSHEPVHDEAAALRKFSAWLDAHTGSPAIMPQRPGRHRRPEPGVLAGDGGGNEDFESFYRRTCEKVRRWADAIAMNEPFAEDAVAEAYLEAFKRWDQIRAYRSPEEWVRRAVFRRMTAALLGTDDLSAPLLADHELVRAHKHKMLQDLDRFRGALMADPGFAQRRETTEGCEGR